MVRTKKQGARSRQPSLVHGAAISADQVRYLELLVEDVECTVESTLATSQAIVDRICRYTDVWYDHIIRTVPKEVLDRPYREVWDSINSIPTPDMSMAQASLSSSAGSSLVASNSGDCDPSTSKQLQRAKVVASVEAKKNRWTISKASKVPPKGSLGTPLKQVCTSARASVITPKFDIRKQPTTARKPHQGETLLSLRGSPVSSKSPEAPVHVHVDKGQVVKVIASNTSNESVKKLCEAIESLSKKL